MFYYVCKAREGTNSSSWGANASQKFTRLFPTLAPLPLLLNSLSLGHSSFLQKIIVNSKRTNFKSPTNYQYQLKWSHLRQLTNHITNQSKFKPTQTHSYNSLQAMVLPPPCSVVDLAFGPMTASFFKEAVFLERPRNQPRSNHRGGWDSWFGRCGTSPLSPILAGSNHALSRRKNAWSFKTAKSIWEH